MPVTMVYHVYSYLEVPVLIKYTLPIPSVTPKLYLGPAVAFLVSSKTKYELPGGGEEVYDNSSFITNKDLGAVLGASAHIVVVDLDIRYSVGLNALDKDGTSRFYNRVWTILVGIPLI